jgi:hypothetical protein
MYGQTDRKSCMEHRVDYTSTTTSAKPTTWADYTTSAKPTTTQGWSVVPPPVKPTTTQGWSVVPPPVKPTTTQGWSVVPPPVKPTSSQGWSVVPPPVKPTTAGWSAASWFVSPKSCTAHNVSPMAKERRCLIAVNHIHTSVHPDIMLTNHQE